MLRFLWFDSLDAYTPPFGVSATMKPFGNWGISQGSEERLPMDQDRPSRRKNSGASYAYEWNRFVAWSEAAGRRSLRASSEDVAAYL